MGMFIIRILLTPLAVIDMWVNVVTAMVLWDKAPIEREWLSDVIWKKFKRT
jgi:hypothetical protein